MLFFLVEGFVYAYIYILEPSYVSVVSACEIRSAESFGYKTIGSFTVGSLNESENGIKIYVPKKDNPKEYQRTLKHEQIHRWQYEKFGAIALSCDHKILKYLGEVHAYIGQYF